MLFGERKIVIRSKLKELLNNYYVHNQMLLSVDSGEPFEYITKEEYDSLSVYAQMDYARMTQGQLAELTGLRPNSITEMVRLKQSSINKEQLVKIAIVLNLKSISDIIDFVVED
ncbi:MAG: helix-turn-helix domain-containing protein [Bacillota bacterium]